MPSTLYKIIRKKLTASRMSYVEIAKKTSFTPPTIARFVRQGSKYPTVIEELLDLFYPSFVDDIANIDPLRERVGDFNKKVGLLEKVIAEKESEINRLQNTISLQNERLEKLNEHRN